MLVHHNPFITSAVSCASDYAHDTMRIRVEIMSSEIGVKQISRIPPLDYK